MSKMKNRKKSDENIFLCLFKLDETQSKHNSNDRCSHDQDSN